MLIIFIVILKCTSFEYETFQSNINVFFLMREQESQPRFD